MPNKCITDTSFYNQKWEPDRNSDIPVRQQSAANIERFHLFTDVMRAIGDGYVTGEKSEENGAANYQKLVLTEKGEGFYGSSTF